MSMFTAPGTYDRAITVFSPDGRLFQVEYALETVKRGSIILGIACSEGVVLAAEERPTSRLQDPNFAWKIFEIENHVGVAVSGLSSDARILVDQARIYAQSNRLMYDEPISIEVLSKRIGDIKQLYTQHAGVRPFGISMIFGGVDSTGSKILQTDPSGACWRYKAVAIGAGSDSVRSILEEKYSDSMTLEQSILLALEGMSKVIEGGIDHKKMRIAVIPVNTKRFKKLMESEVAEYIEKSKSL